MLTGRWFWCDRTLEQSLISSFDQGEVVWLQPDAGCQSLINSSKVSEKENPDRTCPVSADRTLVRFWLLTGR